MDLVSLIRHRLVVPSFTAADKFQAIEALVDFLIQQGEVPGDARERVLTAVRNREEERSTGIAGGLALPHGVVEGMEREVAVIGLCAKGIDFGAFDRQLAKVIILLVTPRSRAAVHSEIVRNIAVQMHGSTLLSSLPCCDSVEQAITFLGEAP